MISEKIAIEADLVLDPRNVILGPSDDFFIEYLKPYYLQTRDGQYLFGSRQAGRRPDLATYMVPPGYRLGKKQGTFDPVIGKKLYAVVKRYLTTVPTLLLEGIQGEAGLRNRAERRGQRS